MAKAPRIPVTQVVAIIEQGPHRDPSVRFYSPTMGYCEASLKIFKENCLMTDLDHYFEFITVLDEALVDLELDEASEDFFGSPSKDTPPVHANA